MPRPFLERTSSEPPWACAIDRAMKSPSPVPGFAWSPVTRPNFSKMREDTAKHPIEKVGAELRAMMPWISAGKAKPQDVSGG